MLMDLETIRQAIKDTVAKHGRNTRYVTWNAAGEGCHYEPRPDLYEANDARSRIGCLVGEALSSLGHTDHLKLTCSADMLPQLSGPAGQWARWAQMQQDSGKTWGEALDAAEEWYRARNA